MKHIIWTSSPDFNDWEEDLQEQYPDYKRTELMDLMYEINEDYLDDEKLNLDKELYRPIVMIGQLGLWNGVREGYKFLKETNLNAVLSGSVGDYTTWYVEDGEVCCEDIHHDGTNHYVYRLLKSNYDEDDFEDYAWSRSIKEAIDLMTEPMGHYVSEIYSWED